MFQSHSVVGGSQEDDEVPTIHREGGFRFFFYSGEGNEPPHIHCRNQDSEIKIWLSPLAVAFAFGMNARDQREALRITRTHQKKFMEAWNEFASQKG